MPGGGLRASLRSNLYDAAIALGGAHHSAAFLDGQAGRLLNIDILAGLASQDGHERMPVVGSGDKDGDHVLVLEQAQKILVELGKAAGARGGLVEARRIDVAEGYDTGG